MASPSVRIALIIKAIQARHRRLSIEATKHLITIKSSLIPLVRRRHRRVLEYQPTGFDLDNYTNCHGSVLQSFAIT
jgi:hypothetical protein